MTTSDLDRIVAYAATSTDYDVADLGTFPDWFLAAFNGFGAHDLSPQAVTAAYLLYTRRDDPQLAVAVALERLHHQPPQRLWEIASAFTLSCCLERLKRAGLLESYTLDDPFSVHGIGSCTFPEDDHCFYRSTSSPEQLSQYVRARLDPSAAH